MCELNIPACGCSMRCDKLAVKITSPVPKKKRGARGGEYSLYACVQTEIAQYRAQGRIRILGKGGGGGGGGV